MAMYENLTQEQRKQLNELLSQTTIRSDGTIDGQPNATLAALMNPQMQQQAQPMSSQELSALQMDNSEPDVFYGSGSQQQQAPQMPQNYFQRGNNAPVDLGPSQPQFGGQQALDYASPVEYAGQKGYRVKGDPFTIVMPDGAIVRTGQDVAATRARQKEDLALEKSRVELQKAQRDLQPKAPDASWKEVESGGKLYLINSKTGEMKPAAIGGEQLVGKPEKVKEEKPVPVSAAKGILSNRDNLRKAQTALALISGETVGDMAGDKEATGWKGYAPEAVLQRTDPKGVNTRAAIGDLGSMVIHDRSGAAVTAAEFPRLRPFIPLVTDDPAVAKKKLARFVSEYEALVEDTESFYKESGYKVPSASKDRTTTDGAKAGGNLTPAEQTRLQELRKKYGR